MISGAVLGSCFPPLFGGECSGIPKDCKPCIDVCTGYFDQELVVHLDEDGNIIDILCLYFLISTRDTSRDLVLNFSVFFS